MEKIKLCSDIRRVKGVVAGGSCEYEGAIATVAEAVAVIIKAS